MERTLDIDVAALAAIVEIVASGEPPRQPDEFTTDEIWAAAVEAGEDVSRQGMEKRLRRKVKAGELAVRQTLVWAEGQRRLLNLWREVNGADDL